MEGVAYTFGTNENKEIHFSLDYIKSSAKRAHDEIMGVLVHEVVHCYQYNAYATCPGGLIEGMAGESRRHGYILRHNILTMAFQQILFVYMKGLLLPIGSERLERHGMQVMKKLLFFSTGSKNVTEPEQYANSTQA